MRSKILIYCVTLLLLGCFITGCNITEEPDYPYNPDQDIFMYYSSYLAAINVDPYRAITDYIYFNDERYLELSLKNANALRGTYEIEEIMQIGSDIWAVQVWGITLRHPEGESFINFVGRIDGELRVIGNVKQLPDELKSQINVEDYTIPNSVDINDIIGKIGS